MGKFRWFCVLILVGLSVYLFATMQSTSTPNAPSAPSAPNASSASSWPSLPALPQIALPTTPKYGGFDGTLSGFDGKLLERLRALTELNKGEPDIEIEGQRIPAQSRIEHTMTEPPIEGVERSSGGCYVRPGDPDQRPVCSPPTRTPRW
jgi:hypothetical protein